MKKKATKKKGFAGRKAKVKPKTVSKPVFGYDVITLSHTEVTRERDESSEWDKDDTTTSHTVVGIRKSEHGDIASTLDLNRADTAYLVYVIYSTGDSFGHDDFGVFQAIALFDDKRKAAECVRAIENHNKDTNSNLLDSKKWSVPYKDNDGKDATTHANWIGYFERLEVVEFEEVVVKSELGTKYGRDYY